MKNSNVPARKAQTAQFTCGACGQEIKVNAWGYAECGDNCEYVNPYDLEPGYAFLAHELPTSWKPNRREICEHINTRYEAYLEKEFGAIYTVNMAMD